MLPYSKYLLRATLKTTLLLFSVYGFGQGREEIPSLEDIGTTAPAKRLPVRPRNTIRLDTGRMTALDSTLLARQRKVYTVKDFASSYVGIRRLNSNKPEEFKHLQALFPSDNLKPATTKPDLAKAETKRVFPAEVSSGTLRPIRANWPIYLLLGLISFWVAIRYNYSKDYKNISDGFWTLRGINLLIREDSYLNSRPSALMFVLFSFTYGFLIYCVFENYQVTFELTQFWLFLTISAIVAGAFLLRAVLLNILGYTFSSEKLFKSYIAIIFTSNYFYTSILIPILVLYMLFPDSWKSFLFVVLLMCLISNHINQYLRASAYAINNFRFPKFYLIVYLCAFEIAPILLLLKFFVG